MSKISVSNAKSSPKPQTNGASESNDQGFFLNAANFLLSRFPGVKNHYQAWSKGKRIFIAFLLYLIVLPIIPIALIIIMYIHDPEGFKKSPAFKVLGALAVAQLAAFGLIAAQPPKADVQTNKSVSSQVSNASTSAKPKKSADQLAKDSSESSPSNGRYFENCTAAFDAGVHDIKKSDPSYRPALDGDSDGYACEK